MAAIQAAMSAASSPRSTSATYLKTRAPMLTVPPSPHCGEFLDASKRPVPPPPVPPPPPAPAQKVVVKKKTKVSLAALFVDEDGESVTL